MVVQDAALAAPFVVGRALPDAFINAVAMVSSPAVAAWGRWGVARFDAELFPFLAFVGAR